MRFTVYICVNKFDKRNIKLNIDRYDSKTCLKKTYYNKQLGSHD